ncbi:hypothetical protein GLA29479_2379 [Lysobacter antibioticus]|uniref:Uncharacterized protein n=1 Tax=Lysobacter antibioticus TaxID=84531 RepID=A0A0S2DX84_LYSAN|nr:hypothetical protein GLA29479_2379 [Lysobacter antibioticus]ALN81473.1 hypothetical protein LA76x_3347 [Lysobacter antibioticus]
MDFLDNAVRRVPGSKETLVARIGPFAASVRRNAAGPRQVTAGRLRRMSCGPSCRRRVRNASRYAPCRSPSARPLVFMGRVMGAACPQCGTGVIQVEFPLVRAICRARFLASRRKESTLSASFGSSEHRETGLHIVSRTSG